MEVCMKKFSLLRAIIIAVLAIVFIVALVQIVRIYSDRKEAENTYDSLQDYVSVEDTVPDETQPPETTDTTEESQTEGDTSQIAESVPVTVDFDSLISKHPDVVAWIYGENTAINYPVAQGKDNNQYLRHLLSGKYNTAGTIFADYRNGQIGQDQNYIVYGHNMKDGSMFGSILKYKMQTYYDEHPYLYLLTPDKNYRIELIAGYITPKTSEAYNANFATEEQFAQYVSTAVSKSTFKSNTVYNPGDKVVTLSTCSYEYDNARYVVLGVLKEIE